MRIQILLLLLISCIGVFGQDASSVIDKDAAYTRSITTRAEKIVQTLEISGAAKTKRVTEIITGQYRNLNTIYTERDDQVKQIREKGTSKEDTDNELKKVQLDVDQKVSVLHHSFLAALSSELTPAQVTKVKDGMTYNVLSVTYQAYTDMIPTLTKEQKDQIMAWLVEARERAMDAESSEKKHAWFGKYKGRINNYLSAAGYDLTKEREAWQKRIKEKEAKKEK